MKPENQKVTVALSEEGAALDKVASDARLMVQGGGGFGAAFAMADAMNLLLDSITPPMMERIMRLMNTNLGFKTDRDPKVWNAKLAADKPETKGYATPYSADVVKQCVVQATLRGVPILGNCWNIIVGQTYITKEGYMHLLKNLEGFKDFRPVIGIPSFAEGNYEEARVRCKATWVYNTVPGSIGTAEGDQCVIAVRVNKQMGTDAIVGKAQRKFLKRVYEQVTGCADTPDGEVDDTPAQIASAGSAGSTVKKLTLHETAALEAKPETDLPVKTLTPLEAVMAHLAADKVTEGQTLSYLKQVGSVKPLVLELAQLSDALLLQIDKGWKAMLPEILKVKVE